MKFIFMLLILFILTDPVLARPVNNSAQCLNIYHSYMDEYGASQYIPDSQMLDFIGRCLPDDSAHSTGTETTYIDGSRHQKLFYSRDKSEITGIKM